jgi:uncharacterized protein YjbI with pentapeptide repeats
MAMIRPTDRPVLLTELRRRVTSTKLISYQAIAGLAVVGCALLACGPAMAAGTPAPPSSPPGPRFSSPSAEAPQYLFSIPTASGSLIGRSDKHLTLRLIGARRYLTRFTDRPLREAFVVANVAFARRFHGYFASSEPNAVLTYTPPGAQIPVSIVLTIGQPRWNARHHTWTFPATRIRKKPDNLPGTTVHIKPPYIPNPRSFGPATLVIDDSAWVVNGCIIQEFASCPYANLSGANLAGADLEASNLTGANLSGANLDHAELWYSKLSHVNLSGASLMWTDFGDDNLVDANFDNVVHAYDSAYDQADLNGAQLVNANIAAGWFGWADLTNANFSGAYLPQAIFSYATLSGTNLSNTNLNSANLSNANFSGANLSGADLTYATLNPGGSVTGANLNGTTFCYTAMANGDDNTSNC